MRVMPSAWVRLTRSPAAGTCASDQLAGVLQLPVVSDQVSVAARETKGTVAAARNNADRTADLPEAHPRRFADLMSPSPICWAGYEQSEYSVGHARMHVDFASDQYLNCI